MAPPAFAAGPNHLARLLPRDREIEPLLGGDHVVGILGGGRDIDLHPLAAELSSLGGHGKPRADFMLLSEVLECRLTHIHHHFDNLAGEGER